MSSGLVLNVFVRNTFCCQGGVKELRVMLLNDRVVSTIHEKYRRTAIRDVLLY